MLVAAGTVGEGNGLVALGKINALVWVGCGLDHPVVGIGVATLSGRLGRLGASVSVGTAQITRGRTVFVADRLDGVSC